MRLHLRLLTWLFLLVPGCAFAQGIVDGFVVNGHDPVQKRPVHLVNSALKVDKTELTNEKGYYRFVDVPAGTNYAVEVLSDSSGILGQSIRPFEVVSGDKYTNLPAMDISKGVDTSKSTTISTAVVTDRESSEGANITTLQLRELPLYNRTFLALSLIQPGVHNVEQGSQLQGAAFSIAGSRPTSTNFLFNNLASPESLGMDNVASSNNQAIPFQVNEAVQELRVVYAVPDLRYGQGTGGVIDIVASQGHLSNDNGIKAWHGSAFEYFNSDALNGKSPLSVYSNSGFFKAQAYATPAPSSSFALTGAFNAISFNPGTISPSDPGYLGYAPQSYNELQSLMSSKFSNSATQLLTAGGFNAAPILASSDRFIAPINQSQFGVSAGGPLFGGKLLVFSSYEGTLIDNPTPIFERVPTALDSVPITANTSDAAVANQILVLFPKPNVGLTGSSVAAGTNTGILGFYQGIAPNYTHVHNVLFRPDIPLPLGSLSLRYTGQLLDQLHDDTLPKGGSYPGNGADRKAQNQSAAMTYNLPLNHLTNIVTIGFTQFRVDEVAQDRGFTSPVNQNGTALSTYVISGIDTRTSGATANQRGLIGGWFDSFWNACGGGGTNCATGSQTSPSPVTPSLDGDFPLARIGAPLSAPSAHRDSEAYASDIFQVNLPFHNQLTIGGDYRYQQNFDYEAGLTRGLVVSNNIGEFFADSEACISCGSGDAFVRPSFDYELRQPSPYIGDLRSSSFGVFLENKMQPASAQNLSRATITYGLRYDYFGQPLDTQNRLWNYSAAQGLVRQSNAGTYDAFDYQCGVSPTTQLDSLYGVRRATFASGWNCTANGKFSLPTNHNLTGRFGISYAIDSKGTTVVRAAVGGYYDHLPAIYNETLLKNRPSPYNVTNPSAIYGQNFASQSCPVTGTQCGFGLATLNSASWSASGFQNNQAASGANILYERDPNHLQTPYSVQFSASVQHKVGSRWLIEAAYVGSVNQRLPTIYDGNYTNEFYCTQGGGSSSTPGGLCNNNTFFPVFTESHFGASSYHSLILRASSQQWHGLTVHGAFTLAKSLDDVAGSLFPQSTDAIWSQLFGRQLFGQGNPVAFAIGGNSLQAGTASGLRGQQAANSRNRFQLATTGNLPSFDAVSSALTTTGSRPISVSHYNLPQNPLAFTSNTSGGGGDYGRSDFDVKGRVAADFVYTLPNFGKDWAHGFLLSGIFVAQTGQPFSVFSGPAYGQVTQRINLSSNSVVKVGGGPSNYISGLTPQGNLAAFSDVNCPSLYAKGALYNNNPTPPQVCVGTSGRNAFVGPAYVSQDLAIEKSTRLPKTEQAIIVRAEFFNLFNRANYYNPISEYSLDGVHVNPEFGLIRSAHDPFTFQLAARYTF